MSLQYHFLKKKIEVRQISNIVFNIKTFTVAKITDIESGKTAKKPEDPTKDGYKFAGWFTNKTYQHQFDFSRDKIKMDWKLYAKWVANVAA